MILRAWRSLPELFRFLALHAATGILVGWGLLTTVIVKDISGLGSLLAASEQGGLATLLLAVFFAITFGAAGIGIAVINLPWDED